MVPIGKLIDEVDFLRYEYVLNDLLKNMFQIIHVNTST